MRVPAQVLVTLDEPDALDAVCWSTPFVVPRAVALPSLVCEVLHPAAHWTVSLTGSEDPEADADDAEVASTGKLEEGRAALLAGGAVGRGQMRQRHSFPRWRLGA